MKTCQKCLAASALLLLGACMDPMTSGVNGTDPAIIKDLPEGLVAMAAPNQNLEAVRIQPEDGCYWYQWAGPVETTYLPLRTREGRHICARPPEAVAASS